MALRLLSLLLFAASLASASTHVSIRSEDCTTHAGLTSSGVPVTFRGKTYVLTSTWGILEETTACHRIDDGGAQVAATLAALDWATGYALLEAPGLSASVDIDDFKDTVPSAEDLDIEGPQTKKGRVVASKSTRHHMPGLAFTFEMLADRMPSAYAGAPIYGKTLDGILSAQWIEVVAGSYSRIREFKGQGTETPNHFFVIPMALIRQSLQAGLPKRTTFQSAAEKLGDRAALLVGKHKWETFCPVNAGLPPKDGVGPIGGGDGVGVGGTMKGAETCTSRVTLQSEMTLETPALYPAAFQTDLDRSLKPGEALLLPFLHSRNVGGYISRVAYFSMRHFFNELYRGKRLWALLPEKPAALTGGTAWEALFLKNREFRQLLLDTYALISSREDERDSYRFLYTYSTIGDSLNYKTMKGSDWNSMGFRVVPADFAKGATWQGRPLRDVLFDMTGVLEALYRKTGGEP